MTTDTTLELRGGQDPEMIKKVIRDLAGGEMPEKRVKKEIHTGHKGECETFWIQSGGEKLWHGGQEIEGLNLDSIRQAHKDAKVLVIEKKNGELTVKELEDEHELQLDKDDPGEFLEMILMDSGEDHQVMHISGKKEGSEVIVITETGEEDGKKTVVVKTDATHCQGKEKMVKVIVKSDEDLVISGDDEEEAEVYILRKGDEEVKVVKKIRVETEQEDAPALEE